MPNTPEKQELRGEICNIISEMLDSQDSIGIYPTTKCYEQLESLISQVRQEAVEETLSELLPYADKEIEDVKFQRHWFKAHIKTYAKSKGIELSTPQGKE